MPRRGSEEKAGLASAATVGNDAPGRAHIPAPIDFAGVLAIADSLPVMVAYLDRQQRYRFVNRTLADWMEKPRQEILGRTMGEVLGDQAYAYRQPMLEAALAGEKQWFIADFEHPTRGTLTVQTQYVPSLDRQGQVAGVILVLQDVTEQRAAELALRESEARFRLIANSAPVPMWVTRVDGSRDFVNQAFHEFFGFPEEQRGFHDWVGAIHPDDREAFVTAQVEATKKLEPFDLTARFRRHDGQWRWLRAVAMLRHDPKGGVIGMVGAASDITEAKETQIELQRLVDERTRQLVETQDQLRQSQKMEALGQLTGGIAHDFNNLLTVVVGGLDLITRQVQDERLLRFATNALSAAERGARLTAQLLAFSRVQRLEIRPTDISALVEEMRPLLKNVLGPGIRKQFRLDPDLPPVLADPTQLEVAILNLAINARDAMSEGGVLSIRCRNCIISEDPELSPGPYVELAITDTGTGMSPEVLQRAIEPFFTTKEVGKGTGLGLSMVYGMARQSGGTVKIDSEADRGTTVRLYFRPAEGKVEECAQGSGGAPLAAAAGARILVVDDDQEVREFIGATLRESGYEVIEAADGKEAIERFSAFRPDLVVLDYIMPGISGAEVAGRLLASRPDQPILFVSGYSETDAIKRIAPNARILAKPFRASVLNDAVAGAVGVSLQATD